MFDAFRLPKRYQKWENYILCFSDFSIQDLKERVSANSTLEIVFQNLHDVLQLLLYQNLPPESAMRQEQDRLIVKQLVFS